MDNESWNGNSRPFNGAEDGTPWEEGESGNPDGRPAEHGASAELSKLYEAAEDLRSYREERLQTYKDECANVALFESMLEELANLDARLKYVNDNLEADSQNNPNQTNSYGRLVSERRKLFKTIDWSDGSSKGAGESFFDMFDEVEDDDDDGKEDETLFDA